MKIRTARGIATGRAYPLSMTIQRPTRSGPESMTACSSSAGLELQRLHMPDWENAGLQKIRHITETLPPTMTQLLVNAQMPLLHSRAALNRR